MDSDLTSQAPAFPQRQSQADGVAPPPSDLSVRADAWARLWGIFPLKQSSAIHLLAKG